MFLFKLDSRLRILRVSFSTVAKKMLISYLGICDSCQVAVHPLISMPDIYSVFGVKFMRLYNCLEGCQLWNPSSQTRRWWYPRSSFFSHFHIWIKWWSLCIYLFLVNKYTHGVRCTMLIHSKLSCIFSPRTIHQWPIEGYHCGWFLNNGGSVRRSTLPIYRLEWNTFVLVLK